MKIYVMPNLSEQMYSTRPHFQINLTFCIFIQKSWSSGWESNQRYKSMKRKVTYTSKIRRKTTSKVSDSDVKPEILKNN